MWGISIKKKFIFAIITGSIFLLSFAGCGIFPKEEESFAPALIKLPDITYKTVDATIGNIEDSITCIGYLVPSRNENYNFNALSGRLKKIHVIPGDVVKEGDLLAELLTDDLNNEIKLQKLALESKKKSYSIEEKRAKLSMESAQEELKRLEEKYEAMKNIEDAYSVDEINDTSREVGRQKENIKMLELNSESRLATMEYDIEDAQIKLEKLNSNFEKSKLFAGIRGTVTYVSTAKEGYNIDAYTNIVSVADPSVLQVEYVGSQTGKFELGSTVEVKIANEDLNGKVVLTPLSLSNEEYEKNKDMIRITVHNLPKNIQIGDSVSIKLVLESSINAVLVPLTAVHVFGGNSIVYILEDNVKVEKNVKTGIKSNAMVEILEGINSGEKVIVE